MFTISQMREGGAVSFPAFNNERHYMVPFFQKTGLPSHLSHWQDTVDAMLEGISSDAPIYFMCDQTFVGSGSTQRRPGVHVDGYWHPDLRAHGGGGHRGYGGHLPRGRGLHRPFGGHGGSHMSGGWDQVDFSFPEALILASNVAGARAYLGEFDTSVIGDGGDCSTLDLSGLTSLDLTPNRAYIGNVGTLHESIPVVEDSYRTMVRLNVPTVH